MGSERVVALSEAAQQSLLSAMAADRNLIAAITEAVTKQQQSEFLEQLKQFALQEAQLTKLREDNARKDQTISDLHQRIAQLNGFLSSMSTGAPSYPIATTYQVPWSAPVAPAPQQFVPPASFYEAPVSSSTDGS